jgi:hypothetical protein
VVLDAHDSSEALATVLTRELVTARCDWRARANALIHMMLIGRRVDELSKAQLAVHDGSRRCARIGGRLGALRTRYWLSSLLLRRWGVHGKLVADCGLGCRRVVLLTQNITGFVAETLSSSEGIDKAPGVDGLEAKLKGRVEKRVAGLGEQARGHGVDVGRGHDVDNLSHCGRNHGFPEVTDPALDGRVGSMVYTGVELFWNELVRSWGMTSGGWPEVGEVLGGAEIEGRGREHKKIRRANVECGMKIERDPDSRQSPGGIQSRARISPNCHA